MGTTTLRYFDHQGVRGMTDQQVQQEARKAVFVGLSDEQEKIRLACVSPGFRPIGLAHLTLLHSTV